MTLKNVRTGAEEISSDGDIELQNVETGPSSGTIVSAGTIRGRDVVLKGYAMIDGSSVALRRASSSAHPNGETDTQVRARRRLRLVDSNVVRIVSGKAPRLVRSTCQQSVVEGTSDSWSLCSGD